MSTRKGYAAAVFMRFLDVQQSLCCSEERAEEVTNRPDKCID
jgi:hypothetical protein